MLVSYLWLHFLWGFNPNLWVPFGRWQDGYLLDKFIQTGDELIQTSAFVGNLPEHVVGHHGGYTSADFSTICVSSWTKYEDDKSATEDNDRGM